MKIRNGFVSNSSSSSFIILGVNLEENSKELCEKYIIGKNPDLDLDEYSTKICCDKELCTPFCPICGKSENDVQATIEYDDILNDYSSSININGLRVFNEDNFKPILGVQLSGDIDGFSIDLEKINSYKKLFEKAGLTNIKLFADYINEG